MRFTVWGHFPNWIEILEMLFYVERGKVDYLVKTSGSRDENQQQTQPTYDTEFGNRTRATLVGGECSHHCAIPVPFITFHITLLCDNLTCYEMPFLATRDNPWRVRLDAVRWQKSGVHSHSKSADCVFIGGGGERQGCRQNADCVP